MVITSRDRRALAVGSLVLGLLLALRAAPWAWSSVSDRRARVAASGALLSRARAELGRVSALEDSAAAVRDRFVALGPAFVSGHDEIDAGEALRGLTNVAAEKHRTRVVAIEFLQDSTHTGRIRPVAIVATLESDLAGLLETLAALERDDQPIVSVRRLQLMASDGQRSGDVEVITGTATLQGWYLTADADSSSSTTDGRNAS